MPEAVIHSETLPEGYRITSTGTDLRIEATGYQPRPSGIVDKMLATLDRAAYLMISQLPKSKWKWDVENLKRIYTILVGWMKRLFNRTWIRKENSGFLPPSTPFGYDSVTTTTGETQCPTP